MQETYARILARPRLLRDDDDLGYLLRTLRHTFVSRQRAAARRPQTKQLGEALLEHVNDRRGLPPDEVAEARRVYAAIAALPDDFRDVLVAIDIVGLSYRETARALRIRQATVASRLFRARERVAHELVGERSAGAPSAEPQQGVHGHPSS